MEVLTQLLGRLHPVIVHLPIGFIILGIILYYIDRNDKGYTKVIPLIFLLGGIAGVLACITGYLGYQSEGFSFDSVKWHLWFGIITALFCFLAYFRFQNQPNISILKKISIPTVVILLLLLISYTGHLGGGITHGEDYLVEPLPNNIKKVLGFETFEQKKIILTEENWQGKQLYEDIIDPILSNKCASCHNSKKYKGELNLTSIAHILKGGENGEIIVANTPEESDFYTRLVLPMDDEDRMPPKDKTPLTNDEIKLIETWIKIGNPSEKSIKELQLDKDLFLSFFPKIINNNYPDVKVSSASNEAVVAIEDIGIHVEKISEVSNFLSVTCINKPDFTDSDFKSLSQIREQIAVLDLGNTKITDAIIEKIATLKNLTILKLDNSGITGSTINKLSGLEHLKSINLSSSEFDSNYLNDLVNFKKLEKVYLHDTNINSDAVVSLNQEQITIDYGNYKLPTIANDTIVY